MAMRRIFWGFCRNWFLMSPLHYLSSRSDFGFEFADIFVFEKRLPAITDTGCRGRAFSALISSLKYLNLHFHNQTAGLSMMYMNTSKNKANRLNYELFICLSHSQTSQAPQSFHMVTLRPHFDGSKLNTDSIENFHII